MRIPVEELAKRYQDRLFATSFTICGDRCDAEDIVQDVFLKYIQSDKDFDSEEHIKRWLLRVTVNRSKDIAMSFWRRSRVPWQEHMAELAFPSEEDRSVFRAVMELPRKYRTVVHLFYYEGYRVKEIAEITGTRVGAIKVRLSRARKLLKETLQEAWNENE